MKPFKLRPDENITVSCSHCTLEEYVHIVINVITFCLVVANTSVVLFLVCSVIAGEKFLELVLCRL